MTTTPTVRAVPHRTRMLLLGLALPVVVAGVAFVVLRSWIPELPDPVAVHWGPSGPDRFAAPESVAWWALAVVVVAALCTGLGWRWGQDAFNRRMALATDWFLTALLTALVLGATGAQRGLADAHDGGDVDAWIYLALGLGVAAAVAAWFLMPGDPPTERPGALDPATRHLPVADGERVLWTATVRQPGALAISTVVCLVAAVIVISAGALDALFVVLAVYAGTLVLAVLFSTARVVVDGGGMTVVLGPGFRARTVAARDIEAVDVVDVHPLREFGGWGMRVGRHGVLGVVLRAGPGIRVTMSDGRRFVVTVPDAETGAALLAGVALRAQG